MSVDAELTSASVRVLLEDVAWTKLDVEVVTALGAFEIESDLRFEPDEDRFRDWITTVEWGDDRLALALTSKLTRTTDYLIFDVEHESASVELEADVRLRAPSGGCSYAFYDASLDLEFTWCGIETELGFEVDDDGFDEAVLELSDLVIGAIPWVVFDMEIEWTPGETAIDLSADLSLDSAWCGEDLTIELEADLPNAPSLLPVAIQEVAIEWSLEPWDFAATAVLDPDEWIDDRYWLELEASAEFDLEICGSVSLEWTSLWSETQLSLLFATFAFEPLDTLVSALTFGIDLTLGRLETVSWTTHVKW